MWGPLENSGPNAVALYGEFMKALQGHNDSNSHLALMEIGTHEDDYPKCLLMFFL